MGLIELFHTSVPSPTVIEVGGFALHWYGLFFALAAACGYLVARRTWRERGLPLLELEQLTALFVLAGLVGARLFDVMLFEWWYFKDHLSEVLWVWQGGLAFHGGLVAGAIVLWRWCRAHRTSWRTLADTFAPALALAQGIGRWGNYANQELFGLPTTLPWGIPIVRAFRPVEFAAATHFHPVFLYEFLGLVFIAVLLWALRRSRLKPGQHFSLYLVLAGSLRFALEFIRLDEQVALNGVRMGTLVALSAVCAGVWLWLYARTHPAEQPPAAKG